MNNKEFFLSIEDLERNKARAFDRNVEKRACFRI